MLHKAAQKQGPDNASGYKTRLGVVQFFIYAIVYMGFVGINVFKPVLMEREIFAGLNLAVVYGFGLIVFALALSINYNILCTRQERKLNGSSKSGEGKE